MNKIIKQVMRGMISWKVQKDGLTVRESTSPYSNLILNQGLDLVASTSFANCFSYCAVGSGTIAPVKTDVGLMSELRRTNNTPATAEANLTQLTGNIYMMRRTFVFDAVLVPHTYGEVGFSPESVAGGNLFSKALFKNSVGEALTVTVQAGESLTVRYELSIEIYDDTKIIPSGIRNKSNSSGVLRFQKVGLKAVNAAGTIIDFDDTGACNEPSIQSTIFLSNSSLPPEPFNNCIDRSPGVEKLGELSNYVTGSYRRKKGVMFRPAELTDDFRSVGVGELNTHGAVFVFDEEQSPEANKAYVVNFTYVWVYESPSTFEVWLDSEDAAYLRPRVKKVNSYAYFAL